jgi:single-stranded DNA-binding protein
VVEAEFPSFPLPSAEYANSVVSQQNLRRVYGSQPCCITRNGRYGLGTPQDHNEQAGGDQLCVATTAHFKDEEGTIIESTQWHNVVAWEDMAELAVANLQKGSQVYIEGSLRTRSYEAEVREGSKKVNTTLYVTEVVARSLQPIGVHPVTNGKDSTEARA